MFGVAITRWGAPLERELPVLAGLLQIVAYDLRLRLAGPVPVLFAVTDEVGRAQSLRAALRERGHGAVACDLDQRPTPQTMPAPRDFELAPAEIRFSGAAVPCEPVQYQAVLALIHARHSVGEVAVTDTTSKKFSLGRALATGGLSRSKKSHSTERTSVEDAEQALYLVPMDRSLPILLRQNQLRYAGLGARVGRTRLECFDTLLHLLRRRCANAHFDSSLFVRMRKPGTLTVSSSRNKERGKSAQSSTVVQTNADATDLAVHFMVLALVQGQLIEP